MTLLAIDGNSIVNRAFYGIKALATKNGDYTNAIYGFITMLEKLKELYSPDKTAIAFDLRSPTFRHKAYSGYKANRHGMPPELAQQMPVLKELLSALGYTLIECEGYEADDILGTLADECEKRKQKCIIATGDRDSLQLVSEFTSVSLAATKNGKPEVNLYDTEKIVEEYGVSPAQLIEIKALQGDTSDCIPGVAGIGKKGAGELIQKFGNIEYIYDNIDSLDIKESLKNKLTEGKESAFMSRMLGEICKNAPIDRDIDKFSQNGANNTKAAAILTKLEMFSILKRLGLQPTAEYENAAVDVKPTKTYKYEKADTIPNDISKAYFFTFYDMLGNIEEMVLCYVENVTSVISNKRELESFFENENILKFTIGSKQLYKALRSIGIFDVSVDFDVELAAYLLRPSTGNYNMEALCAEYGITLPDVLDMPTENSDIIRQCAALPTLCEVLENNLKLTGSHDLFVNVEIPLAKVLADMEYDGFGVDINSIKEYGVMLEEKIKEYQNKIYDLADCEFNINSPKQLGEVLFEKLSLPSGKKTKSGYSTNAEVLEGLKYAHPIIEPVLEYRAVTKLKSTYCDGLSKVVASDGRIHSSFNQTETRTGRISSTEPNLQNIPVRTPLGRELRRFFKAKDGCVLVDADYSQIELRVLAHIANDKNMINAFLSGEDIHTATASQVFGIPVNMITGELRSRAKAVNFGIVYGIGAFSLSKDIGVSRKEADNYIKSYLSHYSGINDYMNRVTEQAKKDGYVSTMFGRRRYLPELRSSNHITRSFGERVARNMPIQGTAADIIKIAMIKVSNRLEKESLKAKLILQIHDELIVEAPGQESEKVKQILEEEMSNAVKLSVPLPADANIGKTWYDAKK